MIVSVVVCTYNRSELLRGCLNSLTEQTSWKKNYEIIVVDNNSADNTFDVVTSFIDEYPNVRYVVETNQGLSHARNRGYKEAIGEFVAYIDDDAIASEDWIEKIIDFVKTRPGVKVFGGPYSGFSVVSMPYWFPEEYGSFTLGETTRILKENEWINGTNMIYEKKILKRLGGFNHGIGMIGKNMGYGEETELLGRIRSLGISVYYVPDIHVRHLIQEYKLNLRFLLNSSFHNGLNRSKIFKDVSLRKNPCMMFVINLLKGVWIFVFSREKYIKTRIYRSLKPISYSLGCVISYCRQ